MEGDINETFACCFLCLNWVPPDKDLVIDGGVSLKTLCKFLSINCSQKSVESKPFICQRCGKIIRKFEQILESLNAIKMEMGYQLELIKSRISRDKDKGWVLDSSKVMQELRDSIEEKCECKITSLNPQVVKEGAGKVKSEVIYEEEDFELVNFDTGVDDSQYFEDPLEDSKDNLEPSSHQTREAVKESRAPHPSTSGRKYAGRNRKSKYEMVSTPPKFVDALTCGVCGKVCSSSAVKSNHQASHYPGKYPCDFCGKPFQTISRAKRHMKGVHKAELEKRSKNPSGESEDFANSPEAESEMDPAQSASSAPNQAYAGRNKKRKIELTSAPPKYIDPVTCGVCGKVCSSRAVKKKHQAAHYPCKHQCDICRKPFRTRSCVQRHIRSVHKEEAENRSTEHLGNPLGGSEDIEVSPD